MLQALNELGQAGHILVPEGVGRQNKSSLPLQLNTDFATEANGSGIFWWQTPNENEKG